MYVAGWDYQTFGSNTVMVATIWKNGVATPLSNGSADAVAYAVFVAGSDVYVAGKDGNQAKLWKNGIAATLPVGGANKAVAYSVFVSGTDVYVAGREDDGTSLNGYAKLWKNGVGSYLTVSGYGSLARSVVVENGEVVVAGAQSTGGANIRAGVWRNGFFTPLTSGSTDGMAYGVVVK